jgi:hypothetical protein
MTGEYISLASQSKSRNTWRGSIYHWSVKVNPETHDGSVFRDSRWETSDIYYPVMCFGIYFNRPVIYTPPSCVSGFTLTDQWYIFPRHVFRDLPWQTSNKYSPVMCFGIFFERPVIYTPPSCVSGFTLRDQWYILPRHVFRDLRMTGDYISLVCQSKSRNTWRGSIYHWSVKVNPETHDGGVYITGLSK